MADEAVAPDVAELTGCGRAVDMPVAGSALPGGHKPREGFFLAAQLVESAEVCPAPLAWVDVAEMVDVEDAVEAMDELEF